MVWRLACVMACAVAVVAQQEPAPTPTTKARALLEELADPKRCLAAARELTRLGDAALPALHKALVDPRPELVRGALFVAPGLGVDLESLRDPIRRCLKHKDLGVALAAQAALPALDHAGATLLTDYHRSRVVRFVGDDERELLTGLEMAMSVQALADGHLLVAAYLQNRIVEFDASGTETWSFRDVVSPSDAERLPDGNTLVADSGNNRVVEIDRDGVIVWTYAENVCPIDVDRLANGNTLIASYQASGVVEVDRSGKVVWQWKAENARDADRLYDGTTLVTDTDGKCVLRVDAQHRTLRTWRLDFKANDAELLPNGHLVVGGSGALVEFDHRSEEVWRAKVGHIGHLARHGVARR